MILIWFYYDSIRISLWLVLWLYYGFNYILSRRSSGFKKPKQNKTKQPKYNKLNNKYSKDCEDKCVAWPNVFLWRFLFDLCENTLYVAVTKLLQQNTLTTSLLCRYVCSMWILYGSYVDPYINPICIHILILYKSFYWS